MKACPSVMVADSLINPFIRATDSPKRLFWKRAIATQFN